MGMQCYKTNLRKPFAAAFFIFWSAVADSQQFNEITRICHRGKYCKNRAVLRCCLLFA